MSKPVFEASSAAARARSWCRVDLAGGTLDIWPLGLLHPGSCTINVAIDLPAEVGMERRESGYRVRQGEVDLVATSSSELASHPEGALVGQVLAHFEVPPVDVELVSGSPRGGGLGGSSALVIASIAAAEAIVGREPSTVVERVALARDLEARLMSLPTGTQDHYPGLLGGVLELRHRPGGTDVRSLACDIERLAESLLIAYTGESHFSAGANWTIVRRRLEQDAEVIELFDGIAEAAEDVREALGAGDLPRVGSAMAREWSFRKRLAAGISVPPIEVLLAAAEESGAWGGKACGAGGGGCVAVLGPPRRRDEIAAALEKVGGKIIPARPTSRRLELSRG